MYIVFERTWEWDEVGRELECALCAMPISTGSVDALAISDDQSDIFGPICWECLGFFSERNPERFPSVERYRELLEQYPEPLYPATDAEKDAAVLNWLS